MSLAVDYVKHGLALVPIPLGTKGPVRPGWNLSENAITTIDAAAKMTGNVGLLHLHSSSPSVSIDLDDLESATKLLSVAGVDLIRSSSGPLVLEVNSSPGLEGIELATQKDIAQMMIKSIEKKCNYVPITT